MAVMDKMCGNWKMDVSKTENQEAYLDAVGVPPKVKQKMLNEENITAQISRDGDSFSIVMAFGDHVEQPVNFKLNEGFKSKLMGMDFDNIFKVEGDVLHGEHEVGGKVMKSRRYMNGDTEIVVESETDGVTTKYSFVKC